MRMTRISGVFFLAAFVLACLPNQSLWAQDRGKAVSDFETRCQAAGVVRCFGFDSAAEVLPHLDPAWDGTIRGEIDTSVKASGNGSLRFTIPTHSSANTSGAFWLEFADDLSVQFGTGQEFYVQWRQRFSPELLDTHYAEANGWKQAIIGEGSRPGHNAHSCTDIEIVLENTYQNKIPRMYHSCGAKDGHYEELLIHDPQRGYLLQNAVGCQHSNVTSPPCVKYYPNQWMTFQVHVKIGTWYANDEKYHHDSIVQLWVAQEGKPSKLVIDLDPKHGTGYDLANPDPSHAKYGKIWFLPYDTNKDSNQDHATAYTWYDDLIISRSRIADPK